MRVALVILDTWVQEPHVTRLAARLCEAWRDWLPHHLSAGGSSPFAVHLTLSTVTHTRTTLPASVIRIPVRSHFSAAPTLPRTYELNSYPPWPVPVLSLPTIRDAILCDSPPIHSHTTNPIGIYHTPRMGATCSLGARNSFVRFVQYTQSMRTRVITHLPSHWTLAIASAQLHGL